MPAKTSKSKQKSNPTITPEEDQPLFSRQEFDVSRDDSRRKSRRRYFVTSAVGGQTTNQEFLKTILFYCKQRQAQLVILPMRGVFKKEDIYPPDLQRHADQFVSSYVFNTNLKALDVMLHPQQAQPLYNLDRLGQKDKSLIIASPKQHMRTTPVSNFSFPHLLFSTGAVTKPDNYAYTRAGMLAQQDHVCGGLIVEVEGEIFHTRQVQADQKGGFNDLDTYYCADKKSKASVEALVLGDYHVGSEDASAVRAWQALTDLVKPKRVVFHDFADQLSTNHHMDHNIVARLRRPEKFMSIETELQAVADVLMAWRVRFPEPEFLMVASNHNEFLDRYLAALKHFNDDHNFRIGNRILEAQIAGNVNPIEWWLKDKGYMDKKTRWLRRDEDLKVAGVQLATHGDKGPNGSRGSIASLQKIGNAIVGHSHSPGILNSLWQVGTTTKLNLDYTIGHASSWLHSSCLLYSNGQRAMINSISGAWRG